MERGDGDCQVKKQEKDESWVDVLDTSLRSTIPITTLFKLLTMFSESTRIFFRFHENVTSGSVWLNMWEADAIVVAKGMVANGAIHSLPLYL
jgi:hypothetical protein